MLIAVLVACFCASICMLWGCKVIDFGAIRVYFTSEKGFRSVILGAVLVYNACCGSVKIWPFFLTKSLHYDGHIDGSWWRFGMPKNRWGINLTEYYTFVKECKYPPVSGENVNNFVFLQLQTMFVCPIWSIFIHGTTCFSSTTHLGI